MVNFCAVFGCGNKGGKADVSFFRFPSVNERFNSTTQQLQSKRRAAWKTALRRMDLTEKKCRNSRICSLHFLTGKPAKLEDVNDPDWVPCIHLGYENSKNHPTLERHQRLSARKTKVLISDMEAAQDACSIHQEEDLSACGGPYDFDSQKREPPGYRKIAKHDLLQERKKNSLSNKESRAQNRNHWQEALQVTNLSEDEIKLDTGSQWPIERLNINADKAQTTQSGYDVPDFKVIWS